MNKYKTVIYMVAIVALLVSGCGTNVGTGDEASTKKENLLGAVKNETVRLNPISLRSENTPSIINNRELIKLERSLKSFKSIKKINKGKRIGIVKPVTKITIGKNFSIDEIQSIEDIKVNDPGVKSQWSVAYTNSNQIWDLVEQNQTVKIAVIDTGIDYNHPDLKNRVKRELGYDFVNDDSDPMDDNGHGTHVAGIIAAQANNEEGIVGIVGDLDVQLIPIKVLDEEGVGYSETIADGIEYAADNDVDIINLSLGSNEQDDDIEKAVKYALEKGIVVIAAAGNDKRNCDEFTPSGIDGVYTIAASNPLNRAARFSNFGECIDVTAPGVKILSTVPNGGYEAWDGTSMAAPIVSGVAAMLMIHDPRIDNDELKAILEESSKDLLKEGEDILTGNGLIDAKKAFDILTGNE